MIHTQQTSFFGPALAPRRLGLGQVVALGTVGGRLEVLEGRVWLTQADDREDHVLARGDSIEVGGQSSAVVEGWSPASPAVFAWQPRVAVAATPARPARGAGAGAMFRRCWEFVDPARRLGAGAVAALAALVIGGAVFGPLSDARSRSLAERPSLHNASGVAVDAAKGSRPHADDASRPAERARIAAQEARRRAAGAA